MKQTAVIVAPGRGTYNRTELGYLKVFHSDKAALLAEFDAFRTSLGQKPVTELDGADRYSGAIHTRGDNASPLIYACAYSDFLSIDRNKFDILAVTGNSMGWYSALACAGALDAMGGFEVVNTMGTLMQETLVGGQLIYPFVDDDWIEIPQRRAEIHSKVDEINTRKDHALSISINLGGMIVLAGNEAGLSAFEAEMPKVQERFPMRLPNHAGFHSSLQDPVAARGRDLLSAELFRQPQLPLVDGRGAIWHPKASNLTALYDYTLGHQVTKTYDFTTAVQTAAREFMPDVFIVLGPGTTLGGATAQCLLLSGWKNMVSKPDFKAAQNNRPCLIAMGDQEKRKSTV